MVLQLWDIRHTEVWEGRDVSYIELQVVYPVTFSISFHRMFLCPCTEWQRTVVG